MAGKENTNPQAIESEEVYLTRLREDVELALQHFGKLEDRDVQIFADSLSIFPDKVGSSVSQGSLRYRCSIMSRELQRCLALLGIRTETHGSTSNTNWVAHTFLGLTETAHDIIIDPSIGQFVTGYNHVFVGTRSQLRSVVLSTHPEPFFELNWGSRSLPISQLRLSSPGLYYATWSSEPTEKSSPQGQTTGLRL